MSKKTKCQQCKYGASMKGHRGIIYEFKKAIFKDYEINYNEGELGCRNNFNYEKEQVCLNNNFSEFEEFKING